MKREGKAWLYFLLTRISGACFDALAVALAYFTAFSLRLTFNEPQFGWRAAAFGCMVTCGVYLLSLLACGCYRLAWRHIRVAEAPRYLAATTLATLVLVALRFAMPSVHASCFRPPFSIAVMTYFFATSAIIGMRVMWRVYWDSRRKEKTLIEREELRFDNTAAARFLVGKCVMVTGAGGSIGSEIVRQVAAAGASKVLMVERGENALYEIDREMRGRNPSGNIIPLMRDAGDAERMDPIFAEHKPDVVLHAAAYKHVPMVEMNPEEGWRNNVEVTKVLAALAAKHGVRRFVLISTDKAVNPVSVMGKTKRAAEAVVMSCGVISDELGVRNEELSSPPNSSLTTHHSSLVTHHSSLVTPHSSLVTPHSSPVTHHSSLITSFCAVRFGNVYGSSGSVVPLWREQISHMGPVTMTHPEMRRYFMTVQEAVSLVLQAASRSEHAIYTLDMGKSVRMLDLAESMIVNAGYRPYVDIPIVFTGIRPGEKLFEEIDVSEKSCYRTDMAKIYITK